MVKDEVIHEEAIHKEDEATKCPRKLVYVTDLLRFLLNFLLAFHITK